MRRSASCGGRQPNASPDNSPPAPMCCSTMSRGGNGKRGAWGHSSAGWRDPRPWQGVSFGGFESASDRRSGACSSMRQRREYARERRTSRADRDRQCRAQMLYDRMMDPSVSARISSGVKAFKADRSPSDNGLCPTAGGGGGGVSRRAEPASTSILHHQSRRRSTIWTGRFRREAIWHSRQPIVGC